MKRAWQITAAVFAIVFAVWAQQSWGLSLTDALGPGPGFFPFWLSLIGLALCIALMVRIARTGGLGAGPALEAHETLFPRGAALRQVFILFGALAGVAVLLEPLGFRIAVAAFCLVVLPALGARSWWVIAVFAVAASFGVYEIFSDLLKVPLPVGAFGL